MCKSVINNLIGSICSPRLQSVSVNFKSLVGEVEHFPWGSVNDLTKVSPYMLKRVEIALQLLVVAHSIFDIASPLSPSEYEGYFRQVCSALPELDKRMIISITVRHPYRLLLFSYPHVQLSECGGM